MAGLKDKPKDLIARPTQPAGAAAETPSYLAMDQIAHVDIPTLEENNRQIMKASYELRKVMNAAKQVTDELNKQYASIKTNTTAVRDDTTKVIEQLKAAGDDKDANTVSTWVRDNYNIVKDEHALLTQCLTGLRVRDFDHTMSFIDTGIETIDEVSKNYPECGEQNFDVEGTYSEYEDVLTNLFNDHRALTREILNIKTSMARIDSIKTKIPDDKKNIILEKLKIGQNFVTTLGALLLYAGDIAQQQETAEDDASHTKSTSHHGKQVSLNDSGQGRAHSKPESDARSTEARALLKNNGYPTAQCADDESTQWSRAAENIMRGPPKIDMRNRTELLHHKPKNVDEEQLKAILPDLSDEKIKQIEALLANTGIDTKNDDANINNVSTTKNPFKKFTDNQHKQVSYSDTTKGSGTYYQFKKPSLPTFSAERPAEYSQFKITFRSLAEPNFVGNPIALEHILSQHITGKASSVISHILPGTESAYSRM